MDSTPAYESHRSLSAVLEDVAPIRTESAGAPSARGALAGVRVAAFYPWKEFEASGAWNRFTCLWKFLLGEDATVTLAFLEPGTDVELKQLAIRHLPEPTVFQNVPGILRRIASSPAMVELRQYSAMENLLLLRYEKSLYLNTPSVGPWLDDVVRSHDIVTCEYPLFAPLLSLYCKKWGKPLVVTSHDALYLLHGRHPRAKERLQRNEIEAMRSADALVFVNDAERKSFGQFGLTGVTVLNTGDVFGVTRGKENESREAVKAELGLSTEDYCLFVGSMHGPNIEAAAEVQRIAKAMPNLSFVIAGSCCAAGRGANVVALGVVADAMLDRLYRGALAVVVPLLHGTGTSVKTFQAFAYGKAVVATPTGVRGFAAEADKQALIVATPTQFPAAIKRLMEDAALRERLGIAARKYAQALDYRIQFQPYRDIIGRLLNRPTTARARLPQALVLVDNNLCDRVGHHYGYARSLKERCAEDQFGFVALAKQGATPDVLDDVAGVGVFSQGIHEPFGNNPFPADWGTFRPTYDLLASAAKFAAELEAGSREAMRPDDLVFLPNAMPRQILGLALLLSRSPLYRLGRYVVFLRYPLYIPAGPPESRTVRRDEATAGAFRVALDQLCAADKDGTVRLATDSADLAKEYAEICSRPIAVLPIPHTGRSDPTVISDVVPPKTAQKLRLIYLGDAREEKGFRMLPAIVRGVFAGCPGGAVEFVLQAHVSSIHHAPMRAVIEELRSIGGPDLHLIQQSLADRDYRTLLDSADIVLLPYDAATYRSRTSGPLIEALCAGKPVLVPRDSWMSRQLADSGAGTIFTSGSAKEAVSAAARLIDQFPSYRTAATNLSARLRSYHNSQSFLRQLFGMP